MDIFWEIVMKNMEIDLRMALLHLNVFIETITVTNRTEMAVFTFVGSEQSRVRMRGLTKLD